MNFIEGEIMFHEIEGVPKGLPLVVAGLILLFYALGILGVRLLLGIVALYIIFLGLYQMGYVEKIRGVIKKK